MRDPTTEGHFLNLTDAELDKHVYRIMRQEHVIELFTGRKNVLVQTHKWKDKFENFQLSLGGTINGERFPYGFKDAVVAQCWTSAGLSEAMWGIYASDCDKRFLRIRSTPRKLLRALTSAHPQMLQDTCFIGKVQYQSEARIKRYAQTGGLFEPRAVTFAQSLLLKRLAFKHECEVRLLYLGNQENYGTTGLYPYDVDPHNMVTQIMADPQRNSVDWNAEKKALKKVTGFRGAIKRSKIYDPPNWAPPDFTA